MFTYEQIQALNNLEIEVYNYVLTHMEKVLNMKIRELADEVHVSTTTVLRFCAKMGCEGYAEFKFKLKDYLQEKKKVPGHEDYTLLTNFIKHIQEEEYDQLLEQAVDMIMSSDTVVFFGIGSSGTLGKYGARYFSDVGKYTQYIDDPFYPIPDRFMHNSILIVLSVSGEGREIIEEIKQYKSLNTRIISITNSENCTVARMADFSITYYMPLVKLERDYNITTQVPLVLILETLGHKIQKRLMEEDSIQL